MSLKCAIGFIEDGSTVQVPEGRTAVKVRECEGSRKGKVIIRFPDSRTLLIDWCAVVEQVAGAAPTNRPAVYPAKRRPSTIVALTRSALK